MDPLISKVLVALYQCRLKPWQTEESGAANPSRMHHLLSSLPSTAIDEVPKGDSSEVQQLNPEYLLNSSISHDSSTEFTEDEKVEYHHMKSTPLDGSLLYSIYKTQYTLAIQGTDETAQVEVISRIRQLVSGLSDYESKFNYTCLLALVKGEVFVSDFEDDFNKALDELKGFGLGYLYVLVCALEVGRHHKQCCELAAWISEQQPRNKKERADQVMTRWTHDQEIDWLDLRYPPFFGWKAFVSTFAGKCGWLVDDKGAKRLSDKVVEGKKSV